ncbi:MAG: hypothetical protein JSS67_03360 [Bacteroidetes bacterium]|nr:hypothetical protein [Bacteroidota bacterium]
MAAVKEYSVEEKLASLVKLQKIDSKLDKIKILKGELPMEVNDLEDEMQGLNSRKTRIEEEINGISEFIEQRKETIKEATALIAKYEKQHENVKNSREFEAINKEIELQQLEILHAEKNIKDVNMELVEKVTELENAKKLLTAKETVLNGKKSELDKIIVETEKEETQYKKLSETARAATDDRLLFSYDRIRNSYRNGLAVVPVERDACGGCYNAIPPQKQSEIRQRKKVIICENCGRILVDDELNTDTEVK